MFIILNGVHYVKQGDPRDHLQFGGEGLGDRIVKKIEDTLAVSFSSAMIFDILTAVR